MNYSSIAQIGLLVIALAMGMTYTKPALVEIKSLQDELFQYNETKDKAAEFNAHLSDLVAKEQSFRASDIQALETLLPSSIDELAIMSDIEVISRKNNLSLVTLSSGEEGEATADVFMEDEAVEPNRTNSKDISVSVQGDYEDFKNMLRDLEQNKYLLEVVNLKIGTVEASATAQVTATEAPSGVYTFVVRAYAFSYQIGDISSGDAEMTSDDEMLISE